jgi:hypothetical protein
MVIGSDCWCKWSNEFIASRSFPYDPNSLAVFALMLAKVLLTGL